jgi:hypothetical protein
MQAMLAIVIVFLVLGSPLWISLAILLLPRSLLLLDVFLFLLQVAIVYGLWWFFWGGGIGEEMRLTEGWQFGGVFAMLPVVAIYIKYGRG